MNCQNKSIKYRYENNFVHIYIDKKEYKKVIQPLLLSLLFSEILTDILSQCHFPVQILYPLISLNLLTLVLNIFSH